MSVPLRRRLRDALPTAMKAGDRLAVAALRCTLAALDNAEAVAPVAVASLAIEQVPIGAGVTEVARRTLTEADVVQIVRDEIASRLTAAEGYDRAGRPERAERLRDEVRVLVEVTAER